MKTMMDAAAYPARTASYPNLYTLLQEQARLQPERIYYHGPRGRVSFRQMDVIARQMAQQLCRQLQDTGKPVLAVSLNNPHEPLLYLTWACLAAGICLALLPPMRDAASVRDLMSQIKAEHLITDIPELQGESWSLSYEAVREGDKPPQPFTLASYKAAAAVPAAAPAFIFQTSGTTGTAKWVQVTHQQCFRAIECMQQVGSLDHAREQVAFITSPLSHSYGLSSLLEYTSVGSAVVLPGGNSPLGAMGELINPAVAEIVTAIEGVPHFYTQMLRLLGRIKLPALRHVGFGGGRVNPAIIAQLQPLYPALTYSVRYGMTETPSVISHKLFAPPYPEEWDASGKVLPIYQMRLVDSEGQLVEPGQPGEIQIKGECLAWPYYGETVNDEFFATGDVGYFNNDQELCIVGRQSAFLKVRDYRLSPETIETAIMAFDEVLDCRVLGAESGLLAELVPASEMFSLPALRQFLTAKLPAYAIPDTINLVPTIPRTLSGKIKRHS